MMTIMEAREKIIKAREIELTYFEREEWVLFECHWRFMFDDATVTGELLAIRTDQRTDDEMKVKETYVFEKERGAEFILTKLVKNDLAGCRWSDELFTTRNTVVFM